MVTHEDQAAQTERPAVSEAPAVRDNRSSLEPDLHVGFVAEAFAVVDCVLQRGVLR